MLYIIKLLIEPFGIETLQKAQISVASSLLIEPFGIETYIVLSRIKSEEPFNRTFWN